MFEPLVAVLANGLPFLIAFAGAELLLHYWAPPKSRAAFAVFGLIFAVWAETVFGTMLWFFQNGHVVRAIVTSIIVPLIPLALTTLSVVIARSMSQRWARHATLAGMAALVQFCAGQWIFLSRCGTDAGCL